VSSRTFDVRNKPVDPATIAALLDGTLSRDDCAAALVRLAKSEREYEELLETAALLSELSPPPENLAESPSSIALVREEARGKAEHCGHLIYGS
jgi:hypothetical protein